MIKNVKSTAYWKQKEIDTNDYLTFKHSFDRTPNKERNNGKSNICIEIADQT